MHLWTPFFFYLVKVYFTVSTGYLSTECSGKKRVTAETVLCVHRITVSSRGSFFFDVVKENLFPFKLIKNYINSTLGLHNFAKS